MARGKMMINNDSALRPLSICAICGKQIHSLEDLMKVPVIDPYDSARAEELMGLVGMAVHSSCWSKSDLWKEVARLAVNGLRYEFSGGDELISGEYAGVWKKSPLGSVKGVGTLFLPRSSSLYDNLFGIDSRGGMISAGSDDIVQIVELLKSMRFSGDASGENSFVLKDGLDVRVTSSSAGGRFFLLASRAGDGVLRAYIEPGDIDLLGAGTGSAFP